MKKIFIQAYIPLLTVLLSWAVHNEAKGQGESFPGYFTYYNAQSVNKPPGSDTASKAIIFYIKDTGPSTSGQGTMFLINTFRDDDTICACLTGHQVSAFFPDGNARPGPFGGPIPLLMNYQGKDSLATINGASYYLNQIISHSVGVAAGGELVTFNYDTSLPRTAPDIALILLDKRQLPVPEYATLGYDFNNASSSGSYYSINHPLAYPQRLQDNFSSVWESPFRFEAETFLPFSIAHGSSGGPFIKKETSSVSGLIAGGNFNAGGAVRDRIRNLDVRYTPYVSVTRISTIEKEIRSRCWKNKDSAEIVSKGLDRKAMLINNAGNLAAYNLKRTITNSSGITAAAETGPAKRSKKSSYLKADRCDLSGFTLPAIYPGSEDSWLVTVAAKEINLNDEFNYTASGLSELNLGIVIINTGTTGSTARILDHAQSAPGDSANKNALFKVYPNPAADGVFHIALPPTGQYNLVVYNMEGKEMYRSACDRNPYRLQLPAVSKGTYLLVIFNEHTKGGLHRQPIIYR